jgi:hypothetical protein
LVASVAWSLATGDHRHHVKHDSSLSAHFSLPVTSDATRIGYLSLSNLLHIHLHACSHATTLTQAPVLRAHSERLSRGSRPLPPVRWLGIADWTIGEPV